MKRLLVLLVGCSTPVVSVSAHAKSIVKKPESKTIALFRSGPVQPAATDARGVRPPCAWDLQWLRAADALSPETCSPSGEYSKDRQINSLQDSPQLRLSLDVHSSSYASFYRGHWGSCSAGLDCLLTGVGEAGHERGSIDDIDRHPSDSSRNAFVRPIESIEAPRQRVQWGSLFKHELLFLSVMNGFRVATEPGTLAGLKKATWGGYFKALGALHGWSDGDGYYETYLGHPIQGAVASYMWIHHDPKYRVVEFGKSRDYWMSRLRAYAWSFAEIEQFKVGLISEATVGQINRYCCAYGFNDHVITSNGGMVWMVGGDALDRYVVRRIEDHTTSIVLRIIARVALNPPLGMANVMDLNYPWHRENRSSPTQYRGDLYQRPEPAEPRGEPPIVPKFEIAAAVPELMRFGNLSCVGGGGVAGYRMSDSWQWTLEVGGCALRGLPKNWSGDELIWASGPQWIRHTESRWSPHAHFRVGGQKVTEKQVDPQVLQWIGGPPPLTDGENNAATKHWESTGLSLSLGGGLDMRVNRAFAWRFANFDYVRSWLGELNAVNFDQGFRFTTGVVLRVGTW